MPSVNGLPYPALSDPNNPPADFLALATAVDGKLNALDGSKITSGTVALSRGGTGATTVAGARDALGVGLVPVAPSSVTYVTGSGSTNALGKITFSGCSKIEVNGVFTSDFQNYRITANVRGSAGQAALSFRNRVAGIDGTGAEYFFEGVISKYLVSGVNRFSSYAANYWELGNTASGNQDTTVRIDIFSPNVATRTGMHTQVMSADSTYAIITEAGFHGGASGSGAQQDGFSLYVPSGTFTGSLQVYGYND